MRCPDSMSTRESCAKYKSARYAMSVEIRKAGYNGVLRS